MGKMWTSLIVAEVAITVAILPSSVFMARESIRTLAGPGFPAEQYLAAEFGVNRESNETGAAGAGREFLERTTRVRDEVVRRLLSEPEVQAVTYSGEIPGSESSQRIEVEGAPAVFNATSDGVRTQYGWDANSHSVRIASVGWNYFDAFQVAPLMGRTFSVSHVLPGANAVVVNRVLADSLFRGNPVGRKIRILGYGNDGRSDQRGPWLEVIGVVPSFPTLVDFERPRMVMYEVVNHIQPAQLAIHMRASADPSSFALRLRAITSTVDPSVFLRNVRPLSETIDATHLPLRLGTTGLVAVALSVLALSSAGLYALMLVTVTQRRREIGIRMALGADRRHVLWGIFRRAGRQVGSGIAIGTAIATAAHWGDLHAGRGMAVILPGVSVFMLAVGALAAFVPARRGLAIDPIVVLKED